MADLILTALPMDGSTWRLEWIGKLSRAGVGREFQIDVLFRRLEQDEDLQIATDQMKILPVAASELSMFAIGSLWINGILAGDAGLPATLLVDFGVLGSPTIVLNQSGAGTATDSQRFGSLVIPKHFPKTTHLKFKLHPSEPFALVCIPLFEVAKAWYLRDSAIGQRMFSAPIASAMRRLTKRSSNLGDGKITIELADGLGASALPVAAMLEFDPAIMRCGRRIMTNFASMTARGATAYVEAFPPVHGLQRIKTLGEAGVVADGEKFRRCFYVHRLLEVPYPKIDSIVWSRRRDEYQKSGEHHQTEADGSRSGAASHAEIVNVSGSGGKKGSPLTTKIGRPAELSGFPAVTADIYVGQRILEPVPARKESRTSEAAPEKAGLSGRRGEGTKKHVRVSPIRQANSGRLLKPTFENFARVSVRLSRMTEVNVMRFRTPRVLEGSDGYANVTEVAGSRAWSSIDGRRRKLVFMEVRFGGKSFLFLEVERRHEWEELAACMVWGNAKYAISHSAIDAISEALAVGRGLWNMVRDPYRHKTFAHKYVSVDAFSIGIRNFLAKTKGEKPP